MPGMVLNYNPPMSASHIAGIRPGSHAWSLGKFFRVVKVDKLVWESMGSVYKEILWPLPSRQCVERFCGGTTCCYKQEAYSQAFRNSQTRDNESHKTEVSGICCRE
jgi:hypothetical protein